MQFLRTVNAGDAMQAVSMTGDYNGMADCISKTLRHEGIRGLYVPLCPHMAAWRLLVPVPTRSSVLVLVA